MATTSQPTRAERTALSRTPEVYKQVLALPVEELHEVQSLVPHDPPFGEVPLWVELVLLVIGRTGSGIDTTAPMAVIDGLEKHGIEVDAPAMLHASPGNPWIDQRVQDTFEQMEPRRGARRARREQPVLAQAVDEAMAQSAAPVVPRGRRRL